MPKKATLALDIAAAVLATVAVLPQITGIAAHEWLGLVALAAFLLHLAASLNALSSLLKAARFGSALAVARSAVHCDCGLHSIWRAYQCDGLTHVRAVRAGLFHMESVACGFGQDSFGFGARACGKPRWQARCPGEEIVCD